MSRSNLIVQVKRVTGAPHLLPLPFLSISWLFLLIFSCSCLWTAGVSGAEEDCPWFGNTRVPPTIKANCLCARNRTSYNQLSVQCHDVDGQQLVSILSGSRAGLKDPLELLYLNGSHVTDTNGQVPARLFRELKLVSLQLSSCSIKSIHEDAFRGQETHLKHLSLAQNQLTGVPTDSLERLTQLALLDMSYNKITKIPQNAFETLTKLSTLKLNDNNLELDTHSFQGLENSLRNLNLKGTRISIIPEAITNLSSLAFLDLAQNRLRDLEALPFVQLHSLTVLNLERNLLQSLPESVFTGVNDTLSSLSLLNNLITHFPKEALYPLKELRVLDLGFNLLTEIPTDAFTGLSSLTLLALDGNPLATLPLSSFKPLNSTLRGLSLGGRFLSCDCRIKWVSDWIHEYDLQVTSRERNPQFCGSPPALRQYNFYQIQQEDFKCDKNDGTSSTSTTTTTTAPEYENSSEDLTLDINSKPFITASNENQNVKIRPNIRKLRPKLPSTPSTAVEAESNKASEGPQQQQENFSERDKPLLTAPASYENENDNENNSEANGNNHNNNENEEYETESESAEDTHDTASSNSEPVERPALVSSTTPKPSPPLPPITTQRSPPPPPVSGVTTTSPGKIIRPSVIKSFPGIRPKIQPKVITTTTSSTSVTSTSTSSTMKDAQEDYNGNSNTNFPLVSSPTLFNGNSNNNLRNFARATTNLPPTPISTPSTTSTLTTQRPHINNNNQRFSPSESIQVRKPAVSFDGPDFDESKIPVITGVGPIRTISGSGSLNPNSNSNNNNAGSVIPVKSGNGPIIQTQSHHNHPLQLPPPPPPPQTSTSLNIINSRPPNLIFAEKSEILLKDIERNNDMVFLHWDSQKQVAGFRIIYRIFGEDTFRHGPPLASTEREYRIKSIPVNECIVVCVVPYEDILYNEISPSAASVPPGSQCRELKPTSPSALMSNMDKITIGASAAICATVLLAVFIFILITRRSKNRRSNSGLISKIPPGSMMSPSPGPPNMITPGSLSLIKEWDQLSAISGRSIPRARVYHGNPIMEGSMANGHSHGTSRSVVLPIQQQQQQQHSQPQHGQQRSVPDGHSTHRSYLSSHHAHHNHSMHGYGQQHSHTNGSSGHITTHSNTSAAVNSYLNNQSRLLRASLGSRSSQDALNKQLGSSTHVHRHFEQNQKRRRPGVAGRLSQSDSLNTLSGYETPDNWTDHDMDVYVARNATRHDLVQL